MSLPDFTALNERRAEAGLSTFMNPRNAAAGTIRQLDPKLAAERPLSMWAYGLGPWTGAARAHSEGLDWLRERGFPVNDDIEVLEDEDAVVELCLGWEKRRGALDFEIDGVVVKVDDLELQRRLGTVGRDPRWAVAWKFPPTTKVTTLHNVFWNVGKYGDLHPFAALEPVHVGGVTVKLATLHNEEDLLRKDIRPGDEVIVTRAGDVIPQVISPAPHAVERPDRSAAAASRRRTARRASTPTVKREGDVFTRCPNRLCPARRWQLLKHFASEGAMDIEGLGEKQVDVLQREGLVEDRRRLLPPDPRAARQRRAHRRGLRQRLVERIQASKERPFGRVLFGIGIEGVGGVTGRNLAQRFRSIDTLMAASAEEIAETPGIGPKVAALIHEQFQDPDMLALVEDLKGLGLKL